MSSPRLFPHIAWGSLLKQARWREEFLWLIPKVGMQQVSYRGGFLITSEGALAPSQCRGLAIRFWRFACVPSMPCGSGSVTNVASLSWPLPPLQCLASLCGRFWLLVHTLVQACFFLPSWNRKLGCVFAHLDLASNCAHHSHSWTLEMTSASNWDVELCSFA